MKYNHLKPVLFTKQLGKMSVFYHYNDIKYKEKGHEKRKTADLHGGIGLWVIDAVFILLVLLIKTRKKNVIIAQNEK